MDQLAAARQSPDAHGRAGDLVPQRTRTALPPTVAAAPNIAGHRPLLGAIVDVATVPGDVTDPLLWFLHDDHRQGREDHGFPRSGRRNRSRAKIGAAGVRAYGKVGAGPIAEICAGDEGRFRPGHEARVPEDRLSFIVDELNVGSRPVVVETDGAAWDQERDTSFVAAAQWRSRGPRPSAEDPREPNLSEVPGAEVASSAVILGYGGGGHVSRTLDVLSGDVLDAVARILSATRTYSTSRSARTIAAVSSRSAYARDRELATAHLKSAARTDGSVGRRTSAHT